MAKHRAESDGFTEGAVLALNLIDMYEQNPANPPKPAINRTLYDAGQIGRQEIAYELGELLFSETAIPASRFKKQAIGYIIDRAEIVHSILGFKSDEVRRPFYIPEYDQSLLRSNEE